LIYALTLVLPEALTRLVQGLCAGAILFHLREMMIGRPVRWVWPLETAFFASCLFGGWALIRVVRFLYA
jgi:hypothetical protein